MKYYYLTASLPMLSLDEAPPFSMQEFLAGALPLLAEPDQHELLCITDDTLEEGHSAFIQKWRDADTQLRDAVARTRASKRGIDPAPFMRSFNGFDLSVEKDVADAFAQRDPLQRERALARSRWRLVDELAAADPFGLGVVLAFAAKLQIVERLASLDEEAGRAKLDESVRANMVNDQELTGTRS